MLCCLYLFLSSERVRMGPLICLCQRDFEENIADDPPRQHGHPSLPAKTRDNKESLYVDRVLWDLSFSSTNNFKRWEGERFWSPFYTWGSSIRHRMTHWVHMASKPQHPPCSLGKKGGKNSIIKYLEKSFKSWMKLGPEYLVYDKTLINVKEHSLCFPLTGRPRFTEYAQTHELHTLSNINFLWGHWETVLGKPGMSVWLLPFKCY